MFGCFYYWLYKITLCSCNTYIPMTIYFGQKRYMIEGLQFYTTNDVPSILCAYTFQIQANLDQFFRHLIIPSPFSAYTSATNFHCRNLQNWFTQGLKNRETIHAREVRRFNFIFLAASVLVKTLNYSGFSSHTGVGREQKHLDDARTALCVSKILVTVLIRVTPAEPFLMNPHRPSACLPACRSAALDGESLRARMRIWFSGRTKRSTGRQSGGGREVHSGVFFPLAVTQFAKRNRREMMNGLGNGSDSIYLDNIPTNRIIREGGRRSHCLSARRMTGDVLFLIRPRIVAFSQMQKKRFVTFSVKS
jgi:hypothetical protein